MAKRLGKAPRPPFFLLPSLTGGDGEIANSGGEAGNEEADEEEREDKGEEDGEDDGSDREAEPWAQSPSFRC